MARQPSTAAKANIASSIERASLVNLLTVSIQHETEAKKGRDMLTPPAPVVGKAVQAFRLRVSLRQI
jgi:hypothetical protein